MPLTLVSMLSENADRFVRGLAGYLTSRTGMEITTAEHVPWQERERMLDRGEAQIGLFCGLYYVRKNEMPDPPLELLAAPVMRGPHYAGRPVYFSDVVVRRDSSVRSFGDLRGAVWSYNEPHSHSGYNLVRYHLAGMGETTGYFGRVVEAGSHLCSLQLILEGLVSASAIDSTVLEYELRSSPRLAAQLRTVARLGPSSIPPAVVRRDVPVSVRSQIREALLGMHRDEAGQRLLEDALMERFVVVRDVDYDDIRRMAELAAPVSLGQPGERPTVGDRGAAVNPIVTAAQ